MDQFQRLVVLTDVLDSTYVRSYASFSKESSSRYAYGGHKPPEEYNPK
jgi:hypothetical protein